jgi:hypothetical protein
MRWASRWYNRSVRNTRSLKKRRARLCVETLETRATPVVDGTVFLDENLNGTQDGNDPGVANVTVTATDDKGNVETTTTDDNGSYELETDADNLKIVFANLPTAQGPESDPSGGTVQFLNADSDRSAVDLALASPTLVTTQFYYDSALTGDNSDQPAVLSIPYGDENAIPNTLANFSDVGSVWGVAYQPSSNSVYVSSFVKRHAGLGPNAAGTGTTTGGIYRIDQSTDPATVSLLIDLNTAGSSYATGGDPHPAQDEADGGDWYNDPATLPDVGKRGLGGLAISPDGRTLYVMNLDTRELDLIPLKADGTRDAGRALQHIAVPLTNPTGSTITNFQSSDIRPFAITVQGNAVFIGETYTAETGNQSAKDLRAFVYAFDPSQGAFRSYNQATGTFATSGAATPVLIANLNYSRGIADDPDPTVTGDEISANWQRWTSTFNTSIGQDGFPVDPQPWLTSIAFDGNAMILGIRDRFGDQSGFETGDTDPSNQDDSFSAIAVGDLLRASPTPAGTWQLESGGTAGGVAAVGVGDGMGPGGGQFYTGMGADDLPQEVGMGGVAQVPGFSTVATTGVDPVDSFAGGIYTFYNSNTNGSGPSDAGTVQSRTELYSSDTSDTFGSANGLGGLAAFPVDQTDQVGDRVFVDENGNGIQDPGEAGLAGVTLRLFQGSTQVDSTTSDSDGNYQFDNLQPNTAYQIRVDMTQKALNGRTLAPANRGSNPSLASKAAASGTTATIAFTSGAAGSTDSTLDVGFSSSVSITAATSTLGDLVFKDTNNNGLFDLGETGIQGVLMELLDSTGASTGQTTTTDANGIYKFTGLADGTYMVRIAASNFNVGGVLAGWTSSSQSAADPNDNVNNDDNGITNGQLGNGGVVVSGPITLTAGSEPTNDGDTDPNTNLTLDFGMVPPAPTFSIGDTVFIDANNNGLFDTGESPMAGVSVQLLDSQNNVLQTHTTNALGIYTFTGLAAGSYRVQIASSNFTASGLLVGFTSSTGTNGAAIGPYEPGADPNSSIDNDDNGSVSGTLGQANGVIQTGLVTLSASTGSNTKVDLGVFRKFSIGNVVFNDLNNNGTQDAGENGVSGVAVSLLDADNSNAVVATTTTDAQGQYLFANLVTGHYIVELAATNFIAGGALSGFQSSTGTANAFEPAPNTTTDKQDHGTTNGTLGSGGTIRSGTIALGPNPTMPTGESPNNDPNTPDNQNNLTVDFGVFQPVPATASVAGRVFLDFNNSGSIDGPDSGILGATLTLSGGNLAAPLTTQTDLTGVFTFKNLAAGAYTLTETQPAAPANQTGKDTAGNAGGTFTAPDTFTNIVLANAKAATGYLFAEVPIVSTGGAVFEDTNGNGKKDTGEPAVPGVTITLTGTSAVTGAITPKTTTTDSSGNYTFSGLTPGTYTIAETQPTGYFDGQEQNGVPAATVSNDKFAGIDLTSTAAASGGFNFGETKGSSIAGVVYDDVNNDGTQAASGEVGIADVSIRLTGTDDQNKSVDLKTTTGASGAFTFTPLRPGTYKLIETQPAGYADGKEKAGTSSGVITVDDQISGIELAQGTSATGYLFGEHSFVDVAISQSPGSATVAPGGAVTITYTVRNKGTATASAVSALVDFGGLQFVSATSTDFNSTTRAWTIGDLAGGATKTIKITYRAPQAGKFTPSVTATTTSIESTTSNNNASSSVAARISAPAPAPVAVSSFWFLSSGTHAYNRYFAWF